MNWILAEEISQELLLDDVRNIEYRMVGVGTVIFLAGILICVYISRETIKPLGKLMYELENVGKTEDLEQEFTVHGWEEINKICEECNYMLRRIRNLVAEIKESEKKKRRAEMGFLQSQMSPHFLYNTLFSIRCLVDMGEKTKAIGIIDAFTSIMKYILSYKTEFVEVASELKFLERLRGVTALSVRGAVLPGAGVQSRTVSEENPADDSGAVGGKFVVSRAER